MSDASQKAATWQLACLLLLASPIATPARAQRIMENLNRGLVAIRQPDGKVFLSWRLLATDVPDVAFNLYRVAGDNKPVKVNAQLLKTVTFCVDERSDTAQALRYFVTPVSKGKELRASESFEIAASMPARPYLSLKLQTPAGYTPNDASVGDLDGDGAYDIVLHQAGRGRDNSQAGLTDPPILQAYKLDGTLLWTINLGKNIREGAHYTQFMVYDLDGDGRAEIACKTADGTVDGKGKVLGNAGADWRNPEGTFITTFTNNGTERRQNVSGYILKGPEYLTIFDGLTGAALATTAYVPPRHPSKADASAEELKAVWGDGYGNRLDRYLAAVAYLDGELPSLVMCRGYYTRTVLAAWNWRGGKLTQKWVFDSSAGPVRNRAYAGQGNHNLTVADVDNDGKDEIVYGAMVVDDDGQGLYSTGLGHGDALHVSDLIPARPGLEVFDIQERFDDAGAHMRDARTGENIWKKASVKAGADGEGPGRGLAIDIDPRYAGSECWVKGAGITGLFRSTGELIAERAPRSCNFAVWWDGDLLRELLDRNTIAKWDWLTGTESNLLTAEGCVANNGSKASPTLSADLFGDWREEVIWRTTDNQELRIYTTTIPTTHRFVTLMQDPQYRLSIAWQNVAYNQPPHTSFHLGEGMQAAPVPKVRVPARKP